LFPGNNILAKMVSATRVFVDRSKGLLEHNTGAKL